MSNDIDQKLRNIFSLIFDMPVESVDNSFTKDASDSWDSIHQLNLVLSIEEEFGIQFSDAEIPELVSFGVIRDAVHAKISSN